MFIKSIIANSIIALADITSEKSTLQTPTHPTHTANHMDDIFKYPPSEKQ